MPITAIYAPKGGQGVSTIAAALAHTLAAKRHRTLLVDTGTDQPALLAITTDPTRPGLGDYLAPASRVTLAEITTPVHEHLDLVTPGPTPIVYATHTYGLLTSGLDHYDHVVIDATNPTYPWIIRADHRVVVTRACYLALRRSTLANPAPTHAVLITEPGRALDTADVEAVLGITVTARVPHCAEIARAIDAGTLTTRTPRILTRALRPLADAITGTIR